MKFTPLILSLLVCGCAHQSRVRPISNDAKAAIDRALRDMRAATKDTVFQPTKILP